jgi:hypothetical protein
MIRVFSFLVLLCYGISIPVVAAPIRVCLIGDMVLLPGFTTYGETPMHKDKCCPDCGDPDEGGSCCLDLQQLPDAEYPAGPLVLPSLVCCELDVRIAVPPRPVILMETAHVPATPIRGPDSPGSRRALLVIWNI